MSEEFTPPSGACQAYHCILITSNTYYCDTQYLGTFESFLKTFNTPMNLTVNIKTVFQQTVTVHVYSAFFRTSFGATAPPFIDYLKDILQRYPDGGQILKVIVCHLLFFFFFYSLFVH